jgi:hypothetical protein
MLSEIMVRVKDLNVNIRTMQHGWRRLCKVLVEEIYCYFAHSRTIRAGFDCPQQVKTLRNQWSLLG